MGEDPVPSEGGPAPRHGAERRTDTTQPRRARERALKILFQADVRGVTPDVTLERLAGDPDARVMLDEVDDLTEEAELLGRPGDAASSAAADHGRPPAGEAAGAGDRRRAGAQGRAGGQAPAIDGFTRALVMGVAEHRDAIDELIGRYARGWRIARMPVVDRSVLRLATYELLHEPTAPAVVIDEAVRLAKSLSTDDSGRYVNGVLESIRRHLAED
jgi:transcription antitermination factor NusB